MKDTDIEDEKSIRLLSPDHLESQNTVLSQDVFRDSFTWECYEIRKSLTFRIWLLLWLPIIVWWRMSTKWNNPLLASVFLFVGLLFLPFVQWLCHKRILSKQLTEFSKEITKNTPCTDTDDWRIVATNLNSYLYRNKAWNTRYFFFDGADCYKAFRTSLLKPFCLKKDDASKNKTFKNSVPYIEEALQTYFSEFDKKWRLFNTEKTWSSVDLEDNQLPGETYRFKCAWVLKRIFSIRFLPVIVCVLASIEQSKNRSLQFCILYWGGFFFVTVMSLKNMRVLSMKMEDEMQFLSTIINEPEIGAKGWDEIAKKMNYYLFKKKVWMNEEFFFDGTDCRLFFNHNFYSVLSSRKSVFNRPLNVELWPYIKEAQVSRGDDSLMEMSAPFST